jgi:hypothetical protein
MMCLLLYDPLNAKPVFIRKLMFLAIGSSSSESIACSLDIEVGCERREVLL